MKPARSSRLAASVVLWFALGGCESTTAQRDTIGRPVTSQPAKSDSVDQRIGVSEFRAATFNAGLAVGVLRHAEERAQHAVSALARLDVEGLCVQEIWTDVHYRDLESAVAQRLPHALRPPARNEGTSGSCSTRELERVLACVQKQCESSRSRLALCAATRCGHLSRQLSSGCLSCLMRDPERSVGEVKAECAAPKTTGPKRSAAPARPPAAARAYAYGGSYGIALFSRSAPLASDFLSFESRQLARGALYAKLDTRDVAPVLHVFCTHLTASIGGVPYGAGGSWSDEHARQVEALIEWIEEKAPPGEPVLLLGDLNTGPAAGSTVRAQLPAHYARFIASGFESPYLSADIARCTFCSDNPVNGGAGSSGAVIDHALIRGFDGPSHAERVLDGSIEIEAGPRKIRSAYSDHYGVLVTLGSAPPSLGQ